MFYRTSNPNLEMTFYLDIAKPVNMEGVIFTVSCFTQTYRTKSVSTIYLKETKVEAGFPRGRNIKKALE